VPSGDNLDILSDASNCKAYDKGNVTYQRRLGKDTEVSGLWLLHQILQGSDDGIQCLKSLGYGRCPSSGIPNNEKTHR
jgi:hypothetical protein